MVAAAHRARRTARLGQHGTAHGAHTPTGAAAAFGDTYLWVLALTAVAVLPALVLARTERADHVRAAVPTAAVAEAAA
jgi:hypothetical protein